MSEVDPVNPPQSKSRPVLIMNSVLAGLQVVVAGTAFADVVDLKVYGIIALVLAGVQLGWSQYTQGLVTPWAGVVARAVDGKVLAGPAAQSVTNTEVVVSDAQTGETVAPPADVDPEG